MTDATVMTRLREETRDLHASAEGKAFQRRMLSGELSRDEYVDWLGQMLLVHRALEAPLRRLWASDPAFAPLREEQFQEPYLLADLAILDDDPAGHAPLPATAALIAEIERAAARDAARLARLPLRARGKQQRQPLHRPPARARARPRARRRATATSTPMARRSPRSGRASSRTWRRSASRARRRICSWPPRGACSRASPPSATNSPSDRRAPYLTRSMGLAVAPAGVPKR